MKTTLAVAALSLLQIASAQPYRRRHAHRLQHQNAKKDDVVVTVVDTVYAEATDVPEVIVYVDQDGIPVSTTTEYINVPQSVWSTAASAVPNPAPASTSSSVEAPTSTSVAPVETAPVANVNVAVASSSSTPEAVAQPAASSTPALVAEPAPTAEPTTTAQAVPVATTSAAPAATTSAPPSSSSTTEAGGFGLSYSPYNADGTCKSLSSVQKDFESISGYSVIRTYGTDCDQVANVLSVCKSKGFKLFAGIYDLGSLVTEVATIVAAAGGDWSHFDTISVGNELVNSGTASASAVVAAISTARALLKAAGYSGKVVTVDTLVATRDNPSLCDASDYCAVNCHPFFDGTYVAADSGKFLSDMIPTLSAVLANKNQEIVITETGWPWKGQTNGKAVPSLENQSAALSSIKSQFASTPGAVFFFTAFNDLWKSNTASQFQAEQYWGIGGTNPPSG